MRTIVSFLSILLVSCACAANAAPARFEAVVPTAQQETDYVWRNLQDIAFFEQNGYNVSFPVGDLIDALKEKARSGSLTDEDYTALGLFMEQHAYRAEDYERGYQHVTAVLSSLEAMVNSIEDEGYGWNFRFYDRYQIFLTLYGPGGSYNPGDGSIILLTNPRGGFRRYANPVNTLIHEVVHMGIEESIVQRLNVPHGLKERLVDLFVKAHFGDVLPDYRIQRRGKFEN